jgi:hypothetical protein
MTRTIKTRLDSLEAKSPDDHSWEIVIGLDENDHLQTKQYKDGQEVTLAQWYREHKPKPGEPINVKVTD